MKKLLRKIISGGQTGADQGALIAAKEMGIATGGCIPKGYVTENGPNPRFAINYKLYQSSSTKYHPRTKENIRLSDLTIIFSDVKSRGSDLKIKYCKQLGKPYLLSPGIGADYGKLGDFVKEVYTKKNRKMILNVAGDRESKNPGIEKRVSAIVRRLCN